MPGKRRVHPEPGALESELSLDADEDNANANTTAWTTLAGLDAPGTGGGYYGTGGTPRQDRGSEEGQTDLAIDDQASQGSDAGIELFATNAATERALEVDFLDLDDDDSDARGDRGGRRRPDTQEVPQFASALNASMKQKQLPSTLAGNAKNAAASDEDEGDEEDEEADLLGIDDGAEELLGIAQLPGAGPSAFMNPEIEKKVEQLAQAVKVYKEKNRKLREKHDKAAKDAKMLREALEKLEEEKEEAELRAERDLRLIQFKNLGAAAGGGGAAGRHLATDLEAQRKREEARRQMYAATNDQGDDYDVILGMQDTRRAGGLFASVYKLMARLQRKYTPLQRDVRRAEARFGSSVASYFYFFRWMIANYIALALICLIFLIRHITALLWYQNLSQDDRNRFYNSAGEPRLAFDWSSSDWSALSSFLPKFLMISSFNPGDSATQFFADNLHAGTPIRDASGAEVSATSYNPGAELGERMDYISLLIFCNLVLLGSSINKWIREDRRAKAFGLFEDLDSQSRFAQSALNAWDHSISDPREVEDLKHTLLDQYFLTTHELNTANKKKSRSFKERLTLRARRITANFIYISVQGSSAAAIIYLTATSAQMSQNVLQIISDNASLQWLLPIVTLISGSIVPLAVSVINALLPAVVTFVTAFEKWDDGGFHTKYMLSRLFVAKILNAFIQVFSFLQLLDPYMLRGDPIISRDFSLTARTNTEKRLVSVGSTYGAAGTVPRGLDECRADLYGAGIFQLVITEFVVSKTAFAIVPAAKYLIAKLRKRPYERNEFHVAKHMVDLLFFQQLCFMSFPFFPFGTIFIAGMMFLGFKLQLRVLNGFMQKPKKPWSARDAANFFIKFFFLTFVLSFAVLWFMLASETLPKACSLQEHLVQASFDSDPLEQCFDENPTAADSEPTCFMSDRTASEIALGEARAPGLEELRFWEEYFVASVPDGTFADDAIIDTEARLRALLGYPNQTTVSFSSLVVCSLSCGPFVYNMNYYSSLDTYLSNYLKTLYTLATQSPLFVWAIAIIFLLRYLFTKNTIGVLFELQEEKEISLRNLVANLESKIKKLTAKIEKMKVE
ncbi:Transmembrane channel-like protein 5 [Hondaea fermentalgiana]|uniref:Transmembrane channel-like protein 5 n=1 Tax=Hondaea fermentalgiana TaxID=2315210 RepID=A0A2R5GNY3_9STRA|nr:Transmembrane channel-like protein 5 [Hondaea fermentalgiana]|eukprot:GBG31478.1 Transmembrane channel-like protein 5 [Hondaea fermentalgiana]